MTTLESLAAAVAAEPFDWQLRMVFADALEEAGRDKEARFQRLRPVVARDGKLLKIREWGRLRHLKLSQHPVIKRETRIGNDWLEPPLPWMATRYTRFVCKWDFDYVGERMQRGQEIDVQCVAQLYQGGFGIVMFKAIVGYVAEKPNVAPPEFGADFKSTGEITVFPLEAFQVPV
jgi:uncharacterized protein (TIGR02996 family)